MIYTEELLENIAGTIESGSELTEDTAQSVTELLTDIRLELRKISYSLMLLTKHEVKDQDFS